jgi:hypothetical protein
VAEVAVEEEEVAEEEEVGVEEVVVEDICIDLDAVTMEGGIDNLYCGVIGVHGLDGLLTGLYLVIVSVDVL